MTARHSDFDAELAWTMPALRHIRSGNMYYMTLVVNILVDQQRSDASRNRSGVGDIATACYSGGLPLNRIGQHYAVICSAIDRQGMTAAVGHAQHIGYR